MLSDRVRLRIVLFAFASATTVTLAVAPRIAAQSAPHSGLPVAFSADEVRLDPALGTLDAVGHVRVDEPPFHFASDELRLKRVPLGVVLDGRGQVSFCPCLGTPLSLQFSGATVALPHDVILRNPVLQIFGVPIAWAPIVWLRSPGRIGLLPLELDWRGADGLFAGGGVHIPWRPGDMGSGLDLRAGGYVDGGVAVDAVLRTRASITHVLWDRFHESDGITIGAHGASSGDGDPPPDPRPSAAWDIDALRGPRAVQATSNVDAAAQPFDRASGDAQWRSRGWTFASGVRTMAVRGASAGDIGAWGPLITLRRGDAILGVGAYDVGLEGGEITEERNEPRSAPPPGRGATSFVRGEANALLATRLGAFGSTLALRGFGDVADDGATVGLDGAAQARASAALPLAREYASADEADPWVHLTEPRLEAAVLVTHESGILVAPAARGMQPPSGAAWVGAVGWKNAVGRWGSRAAVDADVSAGAVGRERGAQPVLRAEASAAASSVALRVDLARVVSLPTEPGGGGGILVAAARIGPVSGLHLSADVAGRDGTDPIVARALVDPPLEAASGFLTASGWTGGSRLGVPIGSRVTARGGVDVDFDARELVAAAAAIELHDPCNCVVIRAAAAHRIGRPGVDASLSVDLPLFTR